MLLEQAVEKPDNRGFLLFARWTWYNFLLEELMYISEDTQVPPELVSK